MRDLDFRHCMQGRRRITFVVITALLSASLAMAASETRNPDVTAGKASPIEYSREVSAIQLGSRPSMLIADMQAGSLKTQLESCSKGPFRRSDFSIAHRGAPLEYPEHTRESYIAAAKQGAGIIECDVTFTKDRELVCRHAQCDLHTTTNILAIPALAAKCSSGFKPAVFDEVSGKRRSPATARCCTSDLTAREFKTLRGKKDFGFADATTVREFMYGAGVERTGAISDGTLLTHAESIELFKKLGVQMIPELKEPEIAMSADFTQQDYARTMLEEYAAAGVSPSRVWPQSFNLADIRYWNNQLPRYATQLVYLDGRFEEPGFDTTDPATWKPSMRELAAMGVRILAPPLWMLLEARDGEMVPSPYALQARAAGLEIVAWSMERSGSLANGGGWYYRSVSPLIRRDGDMLAVLHVLAHDVGVRGVFSDWPATVTYYANCMGLE
jgi:glycerophosphoryl diester phosphodiesterase